MKYTCALSVDCVIFSGNAVVLIKRRNQPFQGSFALPGGFVEDNEAIESACIREAKEETNLDIKNLVLINVYAEPDRDPRGRVVTFAYIAEADLSMLKAGDDAMEAEIVENWQNVELAFDHRQILNDALTVRQTQDSKNKK